MAISLLHYMPNGHFDGKLANPAIFRETGDNCLGILLHFSVVGSLLYANTSKN